MWIWIFHPILKFRAWRDKRYLKRMITEAKRMSLAENGKQYHVVTIVDSNKLAVVSNEALKHNCMIKINGINRRKISVYSTPVDSLAKKLEVLKRKKLL